MSKKLKYKIISCSSQQPEFPSSSLLFSGQNGGWQTKRFCTYPQQVTFEFYGNVKIDKIEIISDNRKVPSQVDILFYMPFMGQSRQTEERFQKYGYLNFNRNENSQLRQQKSIMVDIKCLYLRFLFHKPHNSKENFFSQIGIQQITVFGNDFSGGFAPIERMPRQFGQNDEAYGIEQDPFVAQKLVLLNIQKEKAVQQQDFQSANQFKLIIQTVKKAGQQLKKLQIEKRKAIEQQDYQKANNIKKSIQRHRHQLNQLISQDYTQQDNIMQENQFNNPPNDQPMLNDFQDNEFVDQQMSEMINRDNKNSRVKEGNSRIKINKSLLKKENTNRQGEKPIVNYDDRVIPTLAGGNKLKTEESQLLENQEGKKPDLKLQDIDGKFIQFATILQEHFEEDTVKRFFSQYWQHKVEALGTILAQTKKKPNADASFIKALIITVKNSISQTNFQVSLGSLQVLNQMFRINSKGNAVGRTNETVNDLQFIIRQVIKKMTDNNNKIKAQAEKAMAEMMTSSLYGPQICTVALTKLKQKVKLSSKQLLNRLIQVEKIIDRNSNNAQIMAMASDFAIQHSKNPASQVRNEALNLLLQCKQSDSSNQVQKKISQKNLSQVIEALQSKAGSKGPDKMSKSKKPK